MTPRQRLALSEQAIATMPTADNPFIGMTGVDWRRAFASVSDETLAGWSMLCTRARAGNATPAEQFDLTTLWNWALARVEKLYPGHAGK